MLIRTLLEGLLDSRRYSNGELANEIGVNRRTLSCWKAGKTTPNLRSCKKLAQYSGLSLDKVLLLTNKRRWQAVYCAHICSGFEDYTRARYPKEIAEDLMTMTEDLIECNLEQCQEVALKPKDRRN